MTIQWFPGHMVKAKREMIEKIKLIDVIVEIVDARAPYSSRNPMVDEIIQNKPRLLILNKMDLADPNTTERWIHYFHTKKIQVIAIDATQRKLIDKVNAHIEQLFTFKKSANLKKGSIRKEIRVLVLGIPNVGKSTLINQLAGKKVASIGNRPGITKGQQWIKIKDNLLLLDSPGILWPKFEDPMVGKKLAIIGTIKDELLHHSEIVFYAIQIMMTHYPHILQSIYALDLTINKSFTQEEIIDLIMKIGMKKGILIQGGQVDVEKTSFLILRDFRSGKLGKISLETPQELME